MKKILINANTWQIRIAITRDSDLQNIYFSSPSTQRLERSYFKGKITKILPGIQTAFVDIGQERAGFLHISEIDRELAIENIGKYSQLDESEERTQKKSKPRERLNISKILKEGEDILLQVSKEPVYEKGAKLTTCYTLPGRFIVLMPNIPRIGVSKKIDDRDERLRLKEIVKANLPEGMGAIIRTTCVDRNAPEIVKDLKYLIRTWESIQKKFAEAKPTEKIHEDLDLDLQIVRDHLDDDVEEVITDDKTNQRTLFRFVKAIAPEYANKIKLYTNTIPIFTFYGIEEQIKAALDKKVSLKSGGSLIIETTEAMTVIDVNTGSFTGKSNLEETILKTNLEAAEEVARQLPLRNIGGLIIIDFIDMATAANQQKLFKFFERILKERDKFQSVILKVSEFGTVQMTRKRSGKTLIQQLTQECPTCKGSGFILSIPSETFEIFKKIKQELQNISKKATLTLILNKQIFDYISTQQYDSILTLEKTFGHKITLATDKDLNYGEYKIKKS